MANVKISELGIGAAPDGVATEFASVQSGVTVKTTYEEIETAVLAATDSREIASSKWTAAPLSTNSITFLDTSDFAVGDAMTITQAAVVKYFIVTAVVSDTSISVAGPPLGAVTITAITKPNKTHVVQVDLFMPGNYLVGGTTTTLLARETRTLFQWLRPSAYLCYVAARQAVVDGSTQPDINITLGGSSVLVTDLSLSGTSWVVADASSGTVVLANYGVSFTEALEVDLTAAAGDLDARDLIVSLGFVLGI
jgi:hypothetical protein